MHRIAQGPYGNMGCTSLAADVVSWLVTDQEGLPVYGFDQTQTGDQYLSALPMEWTHLLQPESGYDCPDPLFLSPSAGDEVMATSLCWDRLTGATVWTIDGEESNFWQSSCRYELLGEDFRVYDELSDASGLRFRCNALLMRMTLHCSGPQTQALWTLRFMPTPQWLGMPMPFQRTRPLAEKDFC
jgi:hypothetical protein